MHPNFREILNHKAFILSWIAEYVHTALPVLSFLALPVSEGSRKLCLHTAEHEPEDVSDEGWA